MKETTPQYKLAKKILGTLKIYDASKTGVISSKNVFVRKLFKWVGWYPNIRMKHFYYENPNSFMAPKIYEYVQMLKGVQLKKSDVALDIGCGEGTLTFTIGKSIQKIIGVDINAHTIESAKLKAKELEGKVNSEFICQKLEKLGFKEASFDKIVSFSVIEHIPNYLEIFQEIFKILKPNGELIISVDSFSHFDKNMRSIHEKTFDVQKYFAKDELYQLLQNLGFRDIQITPIFKSTFAEKWFIRVMNNPNEYFGFLKRFYSFFLYYIISYHEKRVKQQEHGIFLVAKCKK